MQEPILTVATIAAVSGAVGGTASRVVERGVDAGVGWIKAHLSKHGEEVQRRAQANAAEFLIELSNRVTNLESNVDALGDGLDDKLSSPDFAATLQSAIVASARTSDPVRHKLLAEAVVNRLRYADEDPMALAAGMAVEAVAKLSKGQLAFLGLRHGVAGLKHPRRALEPNPAADLEVRVELLRNRFSDVERLHPTDYLHLASVSCAIHGGGAIVWSLESILEVHHWQNWNPLSQLSSFEAGRWLVDVWKNGGQSVYLTLVGATVAAHVYSVADVEARVDGTAGPPN